MKQTVLISGGGSGIGRALTWEFARRGNDVFIFGRNKENLEETARKFPEKIKYYAADIVKSTDRKMIYDAMDGEIKYLIHNAAMLNPVGNILEASDDEIAYNFSVNVESPLFFTKLCLNKMAKNGRIFHVSAGAAHFSIMGWGCYCVTKAALLALYNMLKKDLKKFNIAIGSAFPGVVDTPMQEYVRTLNKEVFPKVDLFKSFKENGSLLTQEKVAECFHWLLTQTTDEIFSEKDWDIEDLIKMSAN